MELLRGGETEQQGAQGEGHGRPGGAGRQRGAGSVGAMWQKGGAQRVRWLVLPLGKLMFCGAEGTRGGHSRRVRRACAGGGERRH